MKSLLKVFLCFGLLLGMAHEILAKSVPENVTATAGSTTITDTTKTRIWFTDSAGITRQLKVNSSGELVLAIDLSNTAGSSPLPMTGTVTVAGKVFLTSLTFSAGASIYSLSLSATAATAGYTGNRDLWIMAGSAGSFVWTVNNSMTPPYWFSTSPACCFYSLSNTPFVPLELDPTTTPCMHFGGANGVTTVVGLHLFRSR